MSDNTSDPEEETTVEVDASETTVESPDAVVEANPTIVVETGADDNGASDAEIDRAVDRERRFAALEQAVAELASQNGETRAAVAEVEFKQEIAEIEAEEEAEQQDAVEDALAEEVTESVNMEDDVKPETAKRHWFFRSWNEWRGRND